jgi:Leucine-rich repeat (LRR) protein
MKKLYPLLFISVLIYWGCEDKDTPPTEVTLWGTDYSIENTTELDLRGQGLTGSIPPEIGNLINLTNLDLRNNQLTGSIPQEIGNITNLERLHLNNNQLTGSIPSEIGNLINLEWLYLNKNQLTGSIPPEIGNMTNLTHLNLWINQLTGVIPESICDCPIDWGGYYTDISDNQLCPPYPECLLGDEFNDDNGNGVLDPGEEYVDSNGNGVYDGDSFGEQDTSNCD